MEKRKGSDYHQNYDIAVKWMAEALRGQTLEVLGIETGAIVEVFSFEPAEITVTAGRVDVMARDERENLYHIEEQRNLRKSDLYRFAAYHFLGAKQWGAKITDVILASGEVFQGEKKIITSSGTYSPVVIDFSQKDGVKRLEEIRAAAEDGSFTNWMELIFLPLYGRETEKVRSELAEKVIRFETGLYHAQKIPIKLLAATLVMSNKLIDKDRLRELWEVVKMLDILEIAREKGVEEGKSLGIQEGKSLGIQEGKSLGWMENAREMLTEALMEKFRVIPQRISDRIRTVQSRDILKGLLRQVFRCENLNEFENLLDQI
ncbi:MAG: hypothetical protein R2941_01700 [Desulfobacterales bacterium]